MLSELNNRETGPKTEPVEGGPPPGMEDHREYFWDVVRFQVSDTRFQLPLYRFVEESEFFSAQHGLSDRNVKDGFSSALVELDVELKDFECFLKAFLPRSPAAYHSQPVLSKLEWISVLKLSTKWRFNELRKTAIEALDEAFELSAMERTLLAKEFDVPAWLMQGYEALIKQMESLDLTHEEEEDSGDWTRDDAAKIGLNVVVKLQSIVIKRYRSLLRGIPTRSIEESVLATSCLREEYEDMEGRTVVLRTAGEMRKREEEQVRKGERRRMVTDEEERRQIAEKEEGQRLAEVAEQQKSFVREEEEKRQDEAKRQAEEHAKILQEQEIQRATKEKELEDRRREKELLEEEARLKLIQELEEDWEKEEEKQGQGASKARKGTKSSKSSKKAKKRREGANVVDVPREAKLVSEVGSVWHDEGRSSAAEPKDRQRSVSEEAAFPASGDPESAVVPAKARTSLSDRLAMTAAKVKQAQDKDPRSKPGEGWGYWLNTI